MEKLFQRALFPPSKLLNLKKSLIHEQAVSKSGKKKGKKGLDGLRSGKLRWLRPPIFFELWTHKAKTCVPGVRPINLLAMGKKTPLVLICSRDGCIYSFEMETGNQIWKHALGHPITSSPCVDEDTLLISDTSISPDRLICVCDSSGSVYVLRVHSNSIGDMRKNRELSVKEFARLDLEGDIFSSPVMIGGMIFVGCRDNHVHCIKLDVE